MNIGTQNSLMVTGETDRRYLLESVEGEAVYLNKREAPEPLSVGESIYAFVFHDGDGKPMATLKKPIAMVGEIANLRVVSVEDIGAFLDWGLSKDLFLPFSEMSRPVKSGQRQIVAIYLDKAGRVCASAILKRHLKDETEGYQRGDKVKVLIAAKTELGYTAVVDNKYWALLFHDEVFQPLATGDEVDAYIKQVRPDKRLDLSLRLNVSSELDSLKTEILAHMEDLGGTMTMGDHSTPEEIREAFGVSKKAFKRSLGSLLKEGKVLKGDGKFDLA
jgi:predicted RNA-binding protein (virulence factor B family)